MTGFHRVSKNERGAYGRAREICARYAAEPNHPVTPRTVAPWALAVAAATAVGAAVAIDPRFLAVVVLLLVTAAAVLYPNSQWQLAPLLVIVISPAIFTDAAGDPLPNGDAAQKTLLIVALGCLALTAGVCWSAIGGLALAAIGMAGAISIMDIGGVVDVTDATAARALVGYALPWLFLFVDWRRIGVSRALGFLGTLPLWCLGAGLLLQLAGVTTVLRVEDTGVPRLQGASIPAHLAMLALFGLAAGLCLLSLPGVDRSPRTYLWVGLNLVILVGTATRGPIVVGVLLVGVFVFHALLGRKRVPRRARRAAWLIAGVGIVAMVASAPELIRRSMGNSYEGAFNTSGRDQAWEFFFGLASQHPYTGRGLGFATVAVEMYLPPHVQRQFVAPHNEYIHLVLDGGVFFLAALLAAMVALFYTAARAQRGITKWVIGTFAVGTLLYAAIDNVFSTPQFTVLMVVMLGLLAAHPAVRAPVAAEPARVPAGTPAVVA